MSAKRTNRLDVHSTQPVPNDGRRIEDDWEIFMSIPSLIDLYSLWRNKWETFEYSKFDASNDIWWASKLDDKIKILVGNKFPFSVSIKN